jgi:hypothetical protein
MKNTTAFANILNAVNKMKESTGGAKDPNEDKIWKCETDKAKNGFAIIRFLPARTDDDVPFVKSYSHGFKSPAGKWFIENCPTTIGEQCPLCEANGVLWNSGNDSDKEIVRERKRKLAYYANILVVSDPKNPDNEGKVKVFKFGAKIFDKILDKLQPTVMEGEDPIEPVNVFDPFEGANFKLKIRQVEGYANYDKSEFEVPSALGKEKEVQAIMEAMEDLNQFCNKSNYKSYEALSTKLAMVMGTPVNLPKEHRDPDVEADGFSSPKVETKKAPPKAPAKAAAAAEAEDDDLSYFKKLAASD